MPDDELALPTEEAVAKAGASNFVKNTLSSVTVLSAWLYILGWSYLHTYFAFFGVNINSLDISTNTFFTAILAQFVWSWGHAIAIGTLIIGCFVMTWAADHVGSIATGVGCAVVILVLFGVGYRLARSNAAVAAVRDVQQSSSPLPKVSLEFEKEHLFKDGDFDQIISSPHLRLLYEDKDSILVFVPLSTNPKDALIDVIRLDKKLLLGSRREVRF